MIGSTEIENGHFGRLCYGRIRPNEDLVSAVEALCETHNVLNGFVRGTLGSLTDCQIEDLHGRRFLVQGPAVEVLSIQGELRPDSEGVPRAHLQGIVASPQGEVTGGKFVKGANLVCVTFEVAIEEWLPEHHDNRPDCSTVGTSIL